MWRALHPHAPVTLALPARGYRCNGSAGRVRTQTMVRSRSAAAESWLPLTTGICSLCNGNTVTGGLMHVMAVPRRSRGHLAHPTLNHGEDT